MMHPYNPKCRKPPPPSPPFKKKRGEERRKKERKKRKGALYRSHTLHEAHPLIIDISQSRIPPVLRFQESTGQKSTPTLTLATLVMPLKSACLTRTYSPIFHFPDLASERRASRSGTGSHPPPQSISLCLLAGLVMAGGRLGRGVDAETLARPFRSVDERVEALLG